MMEGEKREIGGVIDRMEIGHFFFGGGRFKVEFGPLTIYNNL